MFRSFDHGERDLCSDEGVELDLAARSGTVRHAPHANHGEKLGIC